MPMIPSISQHEVLHWAPGHAAASQSHAAPGHQHCKAAVALHCQKWSRQPDATHDAARPATFGALMRGRTVPGWGGELVLGCVCRAGRLRLLGLLRGAGVAGPGAGPAGDQPPAHRVRPGRDTAGRLLAAHAGRAPAEAARWVCLLPLFVTIYSSPFSQSITCWRVSCYRGS